MLSFITQVFDAMIEDIEPKEVQDCLKTIKISYEALLKVVVYNFTQQHQVLQAQLDKQDTLVEDFYEEHV